MVCMVVGDCYVFEGMLLECVMFGGELLGYVICLEIVLMGDGLVVVLKVIEVMIVMGKLFLELCGVMKKFL